MSHDAPYRPRRALGPSDDAPSDQTEHEDDQHEDDQHEDDQHEGDQRSVPDEATPRTDDHHGLSEPPDGDPEDGHESDGLPDETAEAAAGEPTDVPPEKRSPWSRPENDDAAASPAAPGSDPTTTYSDTAPDTDADIDPDESGGTESGSGATSTESGTAEETELSRGRKLGRVGAISALLVVVLAIGYAVFAFSGNGRAAVVLGQDPPLASTPAPPTPTPPVSEDRLLTTEQAKFLASKSTWQVARTQTGRDAQSPVATCLQRPGADDTPTETTLLRTLTASGDRTMAVLHEASAYPGRDQAVHVFGEVARQLGACATDGSYIASAATIDALGNQALAVEVSVTPEGSTAEREFHTLLVIRTGRVLNVIDVATKDEFVKPQILAETMIPVVNVQCTDAVGLCAQAPRTDVVVPPIGGEHPGLPVVADIPRLAKMNGHWAATDPVRDPKLPVGTSCERLGSPDAAPTATIGRAYLVQDDQTIPQTYGWDLVLFTMKDDKQAASFADDVSGSINDCEDRQKTAEVSKATTFSGTGTNDTKLSGTTWRVRQQTGADADTDFVDFRVALVQAGNKVVYLFLPLDKKIDFSDAQWQDLAIRAGQRATQIT